MDITPYVDRLAEQLTATARGAGPETEAAAQRLVAGLDPALRLAMMEALSQAAAEITAELPSGSVDVRLAGRDLDFVLELPATALPAAPEPPAPPAPPEPEEAPEGDVVRITLRLPDSLKTRAEELAATSGQSLNAWLVSAVRRAAQERAVSIDIDLSSLPFEGFPGRGRGGRRMSGWA